jgi:hypothetical protein
MRAEGLCIEHAVVLLDRGQGASALLQSHGITLHSIWSMDELLNYSVTAGRLTDTQSNDVKQQLASMMAPSDGDAAVLFISVQYFILILATNNRNSHMLDAAKSSANAKHSQTNKTVDAYNDDETNELMCSIRFRQSR